MFVATSSTALQAPEGRNGFAGCLHFAPPGLGWFWAGQGYKHGAPTELKNGACLK